MDWGTFGSSLRRAGLRLVDLPRDADEGVNPGAGIGIH